MRLTRLFNEFKCIEREEYMSIRYLCDIFEDMRKCLKTLNFAPIESLIEEAQLRANRMEDSLNIKNEYERLEKNRPKLKDEIKKLQWERDDLEEEIRSLEFKKSEIIRYLEKHEHVRTQINLENN